MICYVPNHLYTGVVTHCVLLEQIEKRLKAFWFGASHCGSLCSIRMKVNIIVSIQVTLVYTISIDCLLLCESNENPKCLLNFSCPMGSLQDLIHWKGIAITYIIHY